jgi:hypothetical protein
MILKLRTYRKIQKKVKIIHGSLWIPTTSTNRTSRWRAAAPLHALDQSEPLCSREATRQWIQRFCTLERQHSREALPNHSSYSTSTAESTAYASPARERRGWQTPYKTLCSVHAEIRGIPNLPLPEQPTEEGGPPGCSAGKVDRPGSLTNRPLSTVDEEGNCQGPFLYHTEDDDNVHTTLCKNV